MSSSLTKNTFYTPFSFSSKKTQNDTVGLLSNFGTVGNIAADVLAQMLAWYEMWINPQKVDIKTQYVQSTKQTAGALVTFHYRRQNLVMDVSGKTGWILNPSADINGQVQNASQTYLQNGKIGKAISTSVKGFTSQAGLPGASPNPNDLEPGSDKAVGMAKFHDRNNNSARVFLQRIRDIADEPMYYVDSSGIEHYNTKYIKIYTKQYPNGVNCEGYYTSFSVPESSDDKQTINYSFSFVIENLSPISEAQQILGKYAGKGTGTGSVIRSFTGG